MILFAYSILDIKVGTYSPPFFMNHDGLAMRAMSETVNDMSTSIGRHPADFQLMKVGYFDDATGAIVSHIPEVLSTALALVRRQQEMI